MIRHRIPEQPLIRREVLRTEVSKAGLLGDPVFAAKVELWKAGIQKATDQTIINRVVELYDHQVVPVLPFGGIMDRYRHVAGFIAKEHLIQNEMLDLLLQDISEFLLRIQENTQKIRFGGLVVRKVPDGLEYWTVTTKEFQTFVRTVWDFGQIYGGVLATTFFSLRPAHQKAPPYVYAGISCLGGEPFYRATENICERPFQYATAYYYDMWASRKSSGVKWRQCEPGIAKALESVLKPQQRIDREQMTTLLCPPERWCRN